MRSVLESGPLSGRVAIVTGGGGGMGGFICRRLAFEGAKIAVLDRNRDGAEGVVEEIVATGRTAVAVVVDIGSEEGVIEGVVRDVAQELGDVSILVNNAAALDLFTADVDITGVTAETWARQFAVNVIGPALLSKHMIASLRFRSDGSKGGSIVNIASAGGTQGDKAQVSYRTTKGALAYLTRCIAVAHAADGIRCNAISPGLIDHGANKSAPERLQTYSLSRAISRAGSPDEMAALVTFLVGPRASHITGQVILNDGGQTSLPASFGLAHFAPSIEELLASTDGG